MYGIIYHAFNWGEPYYMRSTVGVRPICQHNFGNNRMLNEPRIMLE